MLEFIVLGKVPGIHFNITFSWALAFAAIFLIILELRYHKNYALKVQILTSAEEPAVIHPIKQKPQSTQAAKKTAQPAVRRKANAKKTNKKPTSQNATKRKTSTKSQAAKKTAKQPARRKTPQKA